MIEHNAFCNSEPQEDALCGCVDNYDLTDWNDIEPPDWEGGDAPLPVQRREWGRL